MTELGVVLSFLIPFQLLTCVGAMRYTFPVSTSCVSSAHKLMVICPVVSANVLSTSLRFFAPTAVGSARWTALLKKLNPSRLKIALSVQLCTSGVDLHLMAGTGTHTL